MREFIIYSSTAKTSPVIKDLKAAGRIDVLLHSIISSLFASNTFREDVRLHLILMGPPNSPRHIEISYHPENTISKKDLKKLIEMCLRKCRPGEKREVHPGVFVDDDNIEKVIEQILDKQKFFLDINGENIKNIEKSKLDDSVFILGDHDGFDKKTRKFLRKNVERLSLGNQVYFTSQAITIINYELDNL